MDFIDYVNGLKAPGSFQPVSFALHCEIGKILSYETTDLNTTDVDEKEILSSGEIPFVP